MEELAVGRVAVAFPVIVTDRTSLLTSPASSAATSSPTVPSTPASSAAPATGVAAPTEPPSSSVTPSHETWPSWSPRPNWSGRSSSTHHGSEALLHAERSTHGWGWSQKAEIHVGAPPASLHAALVVHVHWSSLHLHWHARHTTDICHHHLPISGLLNREKGKINTNDTFFVVRELTRGTLKP